MKTYTEHQMELARAAEGCEAALSVFIEYVWRARVVEADPDLYDQASAAMECIRKLAERLNELAEGQTPKPKTFGEMTPEEKGALLLAYHEGKRIDCLGIDGVWHWCNYPIRDRGWQDGAIYRVTPHQSKRFECEEEAPE